MSRLWTDEERDALAETFKQASARHGHYETLFAVAGKALDLRASWRSIETAPKDGTPIWAVFFPDLDVRFARPDLDVWNGLQVPLRHNGVRGSRFDPGWNLAAPVGHGGFPDNWIAGWMPFSEPPSTEAT